MNTVAHFVRGKRAFDFLNDFFPPWDFCERQGSGRMLQPVEMFVELENPTVVESQSFPHRIAALHRRIEWADPCFIAMHQLPVDVHNQVAVSLVEFLQHF